MQQTPAEHRQHQETVRLTQARQDLIDERALPAQDPQRRENVIDAEITQITSDDASKVSAVIDNLPGPIQQHLVLQVRPHHTWPEVRQMVGNSPKERASLHPRHRLHSVGSVASSDIELHHAGSTTRRTSTTFQEQQLPPQHQQFQLQGTSDQPISYMPPEGITALNFQQLPQQQQQQPPEIQYQQVRQALP